MLKQIEGSQGVAQAVALCRPDVVCAYPISVFCRIASTSMSKVNLPQCPWQLELPLLAGEPIRRLQARDFFIWPKLSITRAVWAFLLS